MKINFLLALAIIFVLISCSLNPETHTPLIKTSNDLLTATSTAVPTKVTTTTPTFTSTPIPTSTSFGGGSGRLIFGYYREGYNKLFPELKGDLNIFTSNTDGTNLIPITNGLNGYNTIQSISPDKSKILITSFKSDPAKPTGRISRTWDLYLYSLTDPNWEPVKLASGTSWTFVKIADWIDNNKIVYIGQGAQGTGIYIINSDGTEATNILRNNPEITPIQIEIGKEHIYWGVQTKGLYLAYWRSNIDGTKQEPLTSNGTQVQTFNFVVSPDRTKAAWIDDSKIVHVTELNMMDQVKIVINLDSSSESYITWYQDSTKFLLIEVGKKDKNNDVSPYKFVVVYEKDGSTINIEMPSLPPFNILYLQPASSRRKTYLLSPDGRQLLISKPNGEVLERVTLILDMEKKEYSEQFTFAINQSSNIDEPTYGTLFWLP